MAVRLFDPLAVLIVIGGTALVSVLGTTGADARRALAAMRPLFRARPDRDARVAQEAVRQIHLLSEYRGLCCADRVVTPVDFVRAAAIELANAETSVAFGDWARDTLDGRRARHEGAIGVWRAAADVAPSMGMIGTVFGLIGMFTVMGDPDAMGPALATAMLTTLYGLFLASAVAGPIAARLARLSDTEQRWQAQVIARLESLARAEENKVRMWPQRHRPAA